MSIIIIIIVIAIIVITTIIVTTIVITMIIIVTWTRPVALSPLVLEPRSDGRTRFKYYNTVEGINVATGDMARDT